MSDRLHILLLEGSEPDAQRVMDTVRQGGLRAEFHHRTCGGDVDALLNRQRWDLIICNFQLQDISALEVLAALERLELDLPVIVISDGIGEELAVSVMHAGAHDFVTRDNLSRLVPAIERELEEQAIHRRHRQALEALRESELRFRQLAENIDEVFWLLDARSGEMIYLSPAFEETWEQPAPALLKDPYYLLKTIHPEDYHRVRRLIRDKGWEHFDAEYRILLRDGSSRWVNTRSFPIRDEQGGVYRVAGLSIDVSERKQLAEEREMMSRALEQSADAVMITDISGRIVYVNAAFEEITGYTKDEVLGDTPNMLRSGFQDDEFYAQVWKSLSNGIPFTDVFINRRKDGELYYEAKTITPVRGSNGELTHFVSTGKDITDRLRIRERLHKLMHYDAVTGLANRVLLHERMGQAILSARREGSLFGVMCIGLGVSEMLGELQRKKQVEHLLRLVAQRLNDSLEGHVTVARLASDRFVVLLRKVADREEVEAQAKSVVVALNEPVVADGYELFMTPALGISLYPADGETADMLIEHAELAMQDAMGQGHGVYRFYRSGVTSRPKHLSS